jgi:ubiquinone/menaquinone biosynthesis C-methylase UbiE
MNQQNAWNDVAKVWKGYRQRPFRDVEESINYILGQKQTSKHFMQSPKILDIGCGSGRNLLPFAKSGFQCFGIDFSEEMLKFASQSAKQNKIKLGLKYGWAQKIPFPTNSFDYALSIALLHHLKKEDHLHALQEMLRVLKPEGIGLVTVWNHFNPKFWKFLLKKEAFVPWKINEKTNWRYYYFFSFFELKNLIKRAGFKIIKSSSPFARNIMFVVRK